MLMGDDPLTGINYDHRRDWVESQLLTLASAFSIDVAAYAVMSNHLHLVLSVDIYQSNCFAFMAFIRGYFCLAIELITKCRECPLIF
ncbi:protein of unknown function [Shewanella benthica]|uniref:Transposase IS200-like domain-containing protein n=1 Tax=Shewanella benthica TaxID=43661 RepID=A0A330LX77_9GAMM|nr:protein of unknown function [Shewanella benthica]